VTPVRVQIHFKGFFSRLVPGPNPIPITVEHGIPLSTLVARIARLHGPELQAALVDPNDRLLPEIFVVLDGRLVPPQQMEATWILAPCRIAILPLAGGG
jgi:hypothetical protein